MVDWADLTPRLQPGDWACATHGLITPTAGLVPHCPDCGRMALHVEDHRTYGITHVEPDPAACPAGHELQPGRVTVGWTGCDCGPARASAPGGHRWWLCRADVGGRECGQRMEWPPHEA